MTIRPLHTNNPHISLAAALIAFLILSPCSAGAQSPYKTELTKDAIIVSAGLGTGIAALLLHDTLDPLTVEEINSLSRDDVNAFDRGATYHYSASASTASDVLVYTLIASPLAMMIDKRVREDWKTFLLMYAETMVWTGVSAQLVKSTIARNRPFVYNPEVPLGDKTTRDARKSFYSSHTAYAFASALFLSTTYSSYFPQSRWQPYIWVGSLSAAVLVGYLRYRAGMHFPTDILAGAAVGALIGYAIPALHHVNTGDYSLGPAFPYGGVGIMITIRF
jgi:membrane-associated phospholipid phosphatase